VIIKMVFSGKIVARKDYFETTAIEVQLLRPRLTRSSSSKWCSVGRSLLEKIILKQQQSKFSFYVPGL
ncbi:hypothetical protein, partial [Chryseobacterium sp. CH1]|uniref:hypothetical protein n=1 Tax=Chryseobacterium sp. CH1 TaxID=713551 RepID=UPI001E3BE448